VTTRIHREDFMEHAQLPIREAAKRLGVSLRTVQRYRTRYGLTQPPSAPADPCWHEKARKLVAEGASITAIAQACGVQWDTVKRHYPEAKWTPEQISEHSVNVRRLNATLRELGI
jgi:transposase-like protein